MRALVIQSKGPYRQPKRFREIQPEISPDPDFRVILRSRWAESPHEREDWIMGYTIKPMAKEAPALVAVPDDVATDLEGLWEFLAANPDQVAYAKFDTPDERETFIKQARSWGRMREAGALAFRKLAGASLGDDELRFTINVPPTPEEIAAAKAKREAEGKKSPGRPKVNTPAK